MRKLNAQAAEGDRIAHEALLADKFSTIIQNKANFPAGQNSGKLIFHKGL